MTYLPIPTAPPTPNSSDPQAFFDAQYEARLNWDRDALAPGVNEARDLINAAAPQAAAAAAAAQAAAASAISTAGVAEWSPSAVYAVDARARDPVDRQVYVRMAAGSSPTAPRLDAPVWRMAGLVDVESGLPSRAPDLLLDFAGGASTALLACVRASGAECFGPDGLAVVAAPDVPCIDYDPSTGQRLGLWAQQDQTNVLLHSRDYSQAAWTRSGATAALTGGQAPDGSAAWVLTEDSASGWHGLTQATGAASNTDVVYWVELRARERSRALLLLGNGLASGTYAWVDLTSGTVTTPPADTVDFSGTWAEIKPLGRGWYRCVIGARKGAVNTVCQPHLMIGSGGATVYAGDGVSGLEVGRSQMSYARFAGHYIATGAAQATRAADQITLALPSRSGAIALGIDATYYSRGPSSSAGESDHISAMATSAPYNGPILRTMADPGGQYMDAYAYVAGTVVIDGANQPVTAGARVRRLVTMGSALATYTSAGRIVSQAVIPSQPELPSARELRIGGTGRMSMHVHQVAVWYSDLPPRQAAAWTAL